MVAIRLARFGAKKKPFYRVVVMDKRRARDSKTIEVVGRYNPLPTPIELDLQRERIDYWLGVGAQPSDTVKRLIRVFDDTGANLPQPKKQAMRDAAAEVKPAPPAEEKPAEAPAEKAKAEEAKAEEAQTEEAKPAEGEAAEAKAEGAEKGGEKAAQESKTEETG